MSDVEFVVGVTKECTSTFVVYDGGNPAKAVRLRAALEKHRDELRIRLHSLERILAADAPERAESLMVDGTFARIERLVLRPTAERSERPVTLAIEALARGLEPGLLGNEASF